MKIGFFDSGVGGLIVFKAVRQHLPQYDYVFYGDTANVPYGDRSEEEIYELTKAGILRLFEEDVSVVIVACNTASAESLRKLQDTFLKLEHPGRKVLGVIIPTVEVLDSLGVKKPLLIATSRTVESKKYNIELHKIDPELDLSALSAPELVPLIEENKINEAFEQISGRIDPIAGEIDAIVLGCTHYTLLKDRLRKKYKIPVISQDEIIPKKLELYLNNHKDIKSELSINGRSKIILSKENEHYIQLEKQML